ncbi:MAG: sarcosine oxidase subunit gamma family protein [Hoeflea sp.]|uniref:sarcosine oxidase subunit gamma family protein n=1 Tax=Hoeflea sp. TaxID=1940281 RepID=UPI0032ECB430
MPDRATPSMTPPANRLHRTVLSEAKPQESESIRIAPLPEGHVVEVLAKTTGADLRSNLESLTSKDTACPVRAGGPGQWFIVGNRPLSRSEMDVLLKSLEPKADCVDQSHGRIRIEIGGAKVEQVLAKGTAVDLALCAFPVGHATPTQIGHVSTHLTRTAQDNFEIMVLRGFAQSLWDEICLMAREYT